MADGIPTRIFPSSLDNDMLYRMELIGTFLSAIVFGIIVVLLLGTLQILLSKTRLYSKVMQVTLLCYVVFMSSMSLLALVQQIVFVILRAPRESDLDAELPSTSSPHSQLDQTVALPFAIWGADTFLLWRCTVLYTGVSRLHRAAVLLVVTLAALSSLGSGIFFFTGKFIDSSMSNLPTIFIIASSGLVNIVLRTLIVSRILYHQRYIRKAMGTPYASMYTKILTMCVESCAMTSICGAVFLGLYYSKDERQKLGSVVPLILLPHISILTPLLLVYRVARGRNVTTLAAFDTMLQGTMTENTEGHERGIIRFKNPSASTEGYEHGVIRFKDPTATDSTGQVSFLSAEYTGCTRALDSVHSVHNPSTFIDCLSTADIHAEFQCGAEIAHVLPVSPQSPTHFDSPLYR